MTLEPTMQAWFDGENVKKTKQHPWNYSHLLGGFQGARIAYREDLPVLSKEQTKVLMAMVNSCVIRHARM
jgi:hypothetical protein